MDCQEHFWQYVKSLIYAHGCRISIIIMTFKSNASKLWASGTIIRTCALSTTFKFYSTFLGRTASPDLIIPSQSRCTLQFPTRLHCSFSTSFYHHCFICFLSLPILYFFILFLFLGYNVPFFSGTWAFTCTFLQSWTASKYQLTIIIP